MSKSCHHASRGFSLIEVMVALLIVAVALGGVVYTLGNMARNQALIGERTFARWVAANQIADTQLKGCPQLGKTTGKASMAGREWQWAQEVIEMLDVINDEPSQHIRQLRVTVRLSSADKNANSALLVGYCTP